MIDILLPNSSFESGGSSIGWRSSLEQESEKVTNATVPIPASPMETTNIIEAKMEVTTTPIKPFSSLSPSMCSSKTCNGTSETEALLDDLTRGSPSIRLVDYDDDLHSEAQQNITPDLSPESEGKGGICDVNVDELDRSLDQDQKVGEPSSSPLSNETKNDSDATEMSDFEDDEVDEDLAEEEKRFETKWSRQRQDTRWRWDWLRLQIHELHRNIDDYEVMMKDQKRVEVAATALVGSGSDLSKSTEAADDKEASKTSLATDRGWKPTHELLVNHPLFSFSAVTGLLPKRKAQKPPLNPDQPFPRVHQRPPIAHKSIGGGLVDRTKSGVGKKVITHVCRPSLPFAITSEEKPKKKRKVIKKKAKQVRKKPARAPLAASTSALPTPSSIPVVSPTPQRSKKGKEATKSKKDFRGSSERTSVTQKTESEQTTNIRASWGSQKKKSLRTADFDINNIIIPFSMASSAPIPVIKAKEVHTPTWRLSDEIPDPTDEGDSDEDTSDESYAKRHNEESRKEKIRYAMLEKKLIGRTSSASNDLPDNFFVTTESGENNGHESPPGSPRPNNSKKSSLKRLSSSVDSGTGAQGGKGNGFLRSSFSGSSGKKKRRRFAFSSKKRKRPKKSLTMSYPEIGSEAQLAEHRGFCSEDEEELHGFLYQLQPQYRGHWEVVSKQISTLSTTKDSVCYDYDSTVQDSTTVLKEVNGDISETGDHLEKKEKEAQNSTPTSSSSSKEDRLVIRLRLVRPSSSPSTDVTTTATSSTSDVPLFSTTADSSLTTNNESGVISTSETKRTIDEEVEEEDSKDNDMEVD